MNAVSFDTLKFARTLEERGRFTPEQSASLVEALGDVLASDVATKSDVEALGRDLRLEMKDAEIRLQTRIAELDKKLEFELATLGGKIEVDLATMGGRLEAGLAGSRSEIATAKAETIKWFFGVVGFQTIVILGAVVTLARSFH